MVKKQQKTVETRKKKTISVTRFAITYVLLMGGSFFILGFEPIKQVIDLNGVYTEGVVKITAWLIGLFHIPVTVDGSILHLPSISLDVRFGCNGLEAVMIYSVAVITFPSRWRDKILGIVAGFVLIQLINVFRIAGLAYSGVYHRQLFDIIHVYVAQGVMIAIALGVFLLYLKYTGRKNESLA